MKIYRLFILVFIISQGCYGQKNTVINTEDLSSNNIYNNALTRFMENIEESVESSKKKDLESSKDIDKHFSDLYILRSDFTSNSIDSSFSKRLLFLNNEDELEKIVLEKGAQKLLRIIPLRKDKVSFFVNIILFEANIYDGKISLANLTGGMLRYRYNCSANNFAYLSDEKGN